MSSKPAKIYDEFEFLLGPKSSPEQVGLASQFYVGALISSRKLTEPVDLRYDSYVSVMKHKAVVLYTLEDRKPTKNGMFAIAAEIDVGDAQKIFHMHIKYVECALIVEIYSNYTVLLIDGSEMIAKNSQLDTNNWESI